ncbi:MAG: MucR family transcriptional regulator [Rhodospirillales bacterium]|nr:MucR family transcriptional regulator [Rhodospirillales bacterium]
MIDQNSESHIGENVRRLAAEIVAAYVGANTVAATQLPELIRSVITTLSGLEGGVEDTVVDPPKPPVSIRRSVTPDYLVCLEDGKKLKMLKRHLRTTYNMSPQDYREKWGLPADYPMVAPNYAARRSEFAKKIGLGRKVAEPKRPAKRGRAAWARA